jgi:probable F420-dependent oxidoreductase
MNNREVPEPDLKGLGRVGAFVANLSRFTVHETATIAVALESLGYRTLSYGESLGREAFTQAAVLLASSTRLVIAPGIASIYGRDSWSMINGARTLLEAYPGRFVMGVGVSHSNLVARRGHVYASPAATMRAYLESMRDAPWALPSPPRPSVVVAALRRRMLEVVRDCADGAQPYFAPVAHTEMARKVIGDERWLCPILTFIPGSNRAAVLDRGHRHLRTFLKMANYRLNLQALGWPPAELEAAGSDGLFDALIGWGGPSEALARVDAHIAAGADHVQLEVLADTAGELVAAYDALASIIG